jgi:hypothetical protein
MTDIHFDSPYSDQARRNALYRGDIFVYSPTDPATKLCALAKQLISEAFVPHDPRTVDCYLTVEEMRPHSSDIKADFHSSPRM